MDYILMDSGAVRYVRPVQAHEHDQQAIIE